MTSRVPSILHHRYGDGPIEGLGKCDWTEEERAEWARVFQLLKGPTEEHQAGDL